jgi:hypothetical protein
MMRRERGSVVLNLILVVAAVAAVVFLLVPRVLGDESSKESEGNAKLVAVYQTWRIKIAADPRLLDAYATKVVAVLNQTAGLDPVGLQKGVTPPATDDKVFLTTRTGKGHWFQALIKSGDGVCVIAAKGFSAPKSSCSSD